MIKNQIYGVHLFINNIVIITLLLKKKFHETFNINKRGAILSFTK